MPHLSHPIPRSICTWFLAAALLLSACQPQGLTAGEVVLVDSGQNLAAVSQPEPTPELLPVATFAPRPRYAPGELVDYVAQTDDTLPGLAHRFNTTVGEILQANAFIPSSATTMPPGMPMKIPVYYLPLWGSPYRILPDSYLVNGPPQVGFDTNAFVNAHPGWLKNVSDYVSDATRSGAEIVDLAARNYSVSPRLLLALLEYQSGALSQPELDPALQDYPLGYRHWSHKGLYMQLAWASNLLNDGYYRYRTLDLESLEYRDGRMERFDPWQNAATASLHNFFNTLYDHEVFARVVSPDGFAKTYAGLFGDPWLNEQPHIPGSLVQPEFILPFQPGDIWAMTGGPHTGWGDGEPLAALDFAPPSKTSGCVSSGVWATAVAPGVVVRSEWGQVMLDLDGDGDERTGWNIFYLHIGTEGRAPLGAVLQQGDALGHPSCEGGNATGTHIHIARKYNGEWLPAAGIGGGLLAFNLEGWEAHNGPQIYLGTLTRNNRTVTACTCSNAASFVQSDRQLPKPR